ncbi:tail fiber assembly protein [Limnobaculum zhutongyuii]|nr:tail fiber assembly protein [Limnobaculum zhutongyuii]TQS86095.1 tail fiber assembly protein [Limnobaculum zhutongyuii]
MFLYSAINNAFYPLEMKPLYESVGTWPVDGVDVDKLTFEAFSGNVPVGKVRASNEYGLPVWVDIPPPSREELISAARNEKAWLLTLVDTTLNTLKDAVELDMATDKEAERYTTWRKYRVLLSRIDVTKAPDIEWPDKPIE